MTQRAQIYAALVAAGDTGATVKQLQEITGITQPGTVRRELMTLKYQNPAIVRKAGTGLSWYAIPQSQQVDKTTREPFPFTGN